MRGQPDMALSGFVKKDGQNLNDKGHQEQFQDKGEEDGDNNSCNHQYLPR
jgi:hypothetical protein